MEKKLIRADAYNTDLQLMTEIVDFNTGFLLWRKKFIKKMFFKPHYIFISILKGLNYEINNYLKTCKVSLQGFDFPKDLFLADMDPPYEFGGYVRFCFV